MYQASQPEASRIGRYELLSKLATGGMGEIHLARLGGEAGFEKLVVVKLLLPELAAAHGYDSMFLDEARIAARLSHPNVCEVYELGREAGRPFLVMQYLRGVPLSSVIAGDERADPRLVASLIAQAADGLHHAHEARDADGAPLGLVHRDVSPANLFVTVDGVVKVLDFGIAKARGATTTTARDEIKGKYAYMSPEQIRASELDRRSDVFSLGIVLWEGLTGRPLFARSSNILTAKAIIEEAIPRADEVEPSVPPALAEVAARALERSRDRRWPTALAMAEALRAALSRVAGEMTHTQIADAVATGFAPAIRQRDEVYRQASALVRPPSAVVRPPSVPTTNLRGPAQPARGGRRWIAAAGATALAIAAVAVAWTVHDLQALASGRPVQERTLATGTAEVAHPALSRGPVTMDETRESWWALPKPRRAPERGSAGAATPAGMDQGLETAPGAETAPSVRSPSPERSAQPDPGPRRSVSAAPGYVSIESTPWATIYIDGKRAGVTPLIRHAVPEGRRRVRAVLESGQSRSFTMTVRSGNVAAPRRLSW